MNSAWTSRSTVTEGQAPRVAIIGGPDVDARLDLMRALSSTFSLCALGTQPSLGERFAAAGFGYHTYQISNRTNPLTDLRGLRQLVILLRKLRPQIVHTFATRPCVWGRLAARLAGVPVVIGTLPGLGSLYAQDNRRVRLIRAIYGPLQRLACGVSDMTIFQNTDDLAQFVAEGMVPARQASIIPGSGVSTATLARERVSPAQRAALRAELGLPAEATVVTMVSRVMRSKGVLEFMAAAQQLAHHPQLRFLLVGPHAINSVDRLSDSELVALCQAVIWPGVRRDIPTVLAASDVFVLPSTYREGVPRVLLEAASMSLPIITSDAPGCRDVVSHGNTGLLVAPGDAKALASAIVYLVERAELRQRFGLAARQHIEQHFDLTVIADQTTALYEKLLTQANQRYTRSPESVS